MKRKKVPIRKLLLSALIALALPAQAADVRTVTFMVNGQPLVISLDQNPVITYTNDVLHITTSESSTPIDVAVSEITEFGFKGAPSKADANADNAVNAADIVELVNAIMGSPTDRFEKEAADVNGDGVVNAADIVEIVKLIMEQEARQLFVK
jgi:hypothetical protein